MSSFREPRLPPVPEQDEANITDLRYAEARQREILKLHEAIARDRELMEIGAGGSMSEARAREGMLSAQLAAADDPVGKRLRAMEIATGQLQPDGLAAEPQQGSWISSSFAALAEVASSSLGRGDEQLDTRGGPVQTTFLDGSALPPALAKPHSFMQTPALPPALTPSQTYDLRPGAMLSSGQMGPYGFDIGPDRMSRMFPPYADRMDVAFSKPGFPSGYYGQVDGFGPGVMRRPGFMPGYNLPVGPHDMYVWDEQRFLDREYNDTSCNAACASPDCRAFESYDNGAYGLQREWSRQYGHHGVRMMPPERPGIWC